MISWVVVVPWVREEQRDEFLRRWNVVGRPEWFVLQRDQDASGCGATKNRGVDEAVARGADVVVVLDDDCFPDDSGPISLPRFAEMHVSALNEQPIPLFQRVTDPPSRGTPYADLSARMPVAASMGFWTNVGDHCAVRQLAVGGPMSHNRCQIFGRYFPLCGMNLAFRPALWQPWCRFIEVPRFDDIWMGWLWQREAYRRGFCFNLAGPLVHHSRQSNVWRNLREEAQYLERSETLWRDIALHEKSDYDSLRRLLPC